jgi:hypothetical protein
LWRKFKHQTGGGGMGIERAVRADQAGLGGGQLPSAVDDLALGVSARTMFTLNSAVV